MSVAVDQRVLRPASLVRANAAAADHLLHVTFRELVVRNQTTLAGDHLRRKRTCGRIEPLQNSRTVRRRRGYFPSVARFRSRLSEMSCFKRVCVPFWQRIFSSKHPLHGATVWKGGGRWGLRGEPEVRNDAKARVCVRRLTGSARKMWVDLFDSNIVFGLHEAKIVEYESSKHSFQIWRWAVQQPGRTRTCFRRFVMNRRQLHCKERSVCVLVPDEKQMFFEETAFPVLVSVQIKVFFS